jgi:hypothetical protein
MPSHENGRAAKNPGFAEPVVCRVLTDAEIPLVLFARLRKQSKDDDSALPIVF